VGLGQSFGKEWIHVVSNESKTLAHLSWEDYAEHKYIEMLVKTPEHAQDMNKARSRAERSDQGQ